MARHIDTCEELDHRVQFYRDDGHLVASVARFVGDGLRAGSGAIVIASAEHRAALRATLAAEGIAVDAAAASGQLVVADARATLDRLLVDGRLHGDRFAQVVGPALDGLFGRFPRVHAYGEMVDLLCQDGDRETMLELERMWTRFLAGRPIGLLCGYRLDHFEREADAADFHRVCDAHRHVHPADDGTGAEDEGRRRVIASLQQQAVALRGEIAERERVDRELRASEAESKRHAAALEAANAELERFAYVCAHDLREPLRMITQYLGMCTHRHRAALPADAQRCIAFAQQGATRMHELIDALLHHAAAADLADARATDAEAVLAEVLGSFAATIAETRAGVRHDPLPQVHADELGLRQLFTNLIDNALKFRGDRPPVIAISVVEDPAGWTFAVRDHGIGIAPEHHLRIFDILQRLHGREVPGAGIGLAICRRIVDLHGGRLWVESTPGEGATFRFTLPRAQALPAATTVTAAAPANPGAAADRPRPGGRAVPAPTA